MVREFSEEKRQEIFRLLDEIDNREWKSFMEWCGSSAEEFGDWPDKLAVSAYTRYVDEYHKKVLETNEMTRQQVNTVFENVAEINARYAGRMKECQEKIKEQIAMVRTMTEFMDSMSDGNPNMALITKGSVNESIRTDEEVDLSGISSDDAENEINFYDLNDYFNSEKEFSKDEILQILEDALNSGDINQDEYDNLRELFTEMFALKEQLLFYQILQSLNRLIVSTDISQWKDSVVKIIFMNMLYSIDEILEDGEEIQKLYNEIEIKLKKEFDRIAERNQYIQMYINEDFLRNIGFDFEKLGIDNFVVELKRGMIQYNITDEESIQMFLATCMAETGGTDLLEINKNNGDAGSGLIQVTGEAQYRFLRMVLARYEEGSPEWEEIKAICRQFEDADGKYVGYHSTNNSGITPKEYIAENYPIESAVWFWGEYEICYTYSVPHDPDQDKDSYTINQYIELFEDMCAGREEDLFLAVQYYVNGASLKGPYLEELCRNRCCGIDGTKYELTYMNADVAADGSIVSGSETIISLETIKDLVKEEARDRLEEVEITHVNFHELDRKAPNGMEVRFYYFYYIQLLKGAL